MKLRSNPNGEPEDEFRGEPSSRAPSISQGCEGGEGRGTDENETTPWAATIEVTTNPDHALVTPLLIREP